LAADSGNADAQFAYAKCLCYGCGVGADMNEAMRYCKLSADQDDAAGRCSYGICLLNMTDQHAEGARYLKLSADQGYPMGQFWYGRCLENGSGVQIDLQAAVQYYKMCADQNIPMGQNEYARCLYEGLALARDLAEAAKYCKLGMSNGKREFLFLRTLSNMSKPLAGAEP
jgi:TPR repeat protein